MSEIISSQPNEPDVSQTSPELEEVDAYRKARIQLVLFDVLKLDNTVELINVQGDEISRLISTNATKSDQEIFDILLEHFGKKQWVGKLKFDTLYQTLREKHSNPRIGA